MGRATPWAGTAMATTPAASVLFDIDGTLTYTTGVSTVELEEAGAVAVHEGPADFLAHLDAGPLGLALQNH